MTAKGHIVYPAQVTFKCTHKMASGRSALHGMLGASRHPEKSTNLFALSYPSSHSSTTGAEKISQPLDLRMTTVTTTTVAKVAIRP